MEKENIWKSIGSAGFKIVNFLSECDIEYISPSDYTPPEDDGKNGGSDKNGSSNGFEADPYDRIVRGSLKIMEKQRVRKLLFLENEFNFLSRKCADWFIVETSCHPGMANPLSKAV